MTEDPVIRCHLCRQDYDIRVGHDCEADTIDPHWRPGGPWPWPTYPHPED
jgi:hypothetical protein